MRCFTMILFFVGTIAHAVQPTRDPVELKKEILSLAESFRGQADPTFQKQRQLDVLVEQLVKVSPQAPVAQRLPQLVGVWRQVWGPYNYRGKERKVDPSLGLEEIVQYVRADGTYYNSCITYSGGDRSRPETAILRGEYQFDAQHPDSLRVRFTDYLRLPGLPPGGMPLAEVPARYVAGELRDARTLVPSWVVKLFFGKGVLREVYTDQELRILYGQSVDDPAHAHIYIMTRVTPATP